MMLKTVNLFVGKVLRLTFTTEFRRNIWKKSPFTVVTGRELRQLALTLERNGYVQRIIRLETRFRGVIFILSI